MKNSVTHLETGVVSCNSARGSFWRSRKSNRTVGFRVTNFFLFFSFLFLLLHVEPVMVAANGDFKALFAF